MDEHDDDSTSPDLGADEHTNPGVGLGEAYIAVTAHARRAFAAVETMERTCPPPGDPSRARHIAVLSNGWGDFGMLAFDTRRILNAINREEQGDPT